jgi:hypothetical protein
MDFADQAQAVAEAEQNFAAPPTGRAAGPAQSFGGAGAGGFAPPPPQASREGKAQVRANQEKASKLAF